MFFECYARPTESMLPQHGRNRGTYSKTCDLNFLLPFGTDPRGNVHVGLASSSSLIGSYQIREVALEVMKRLINTFGECHSNSVAVSTNSAICRSQNSRH